MASTDQVYDEAMKTADVAVRNAERRVSKVEVGLNKAILELAEGRFPNATKCVESAQRSLKDLQHGLHSPDLARWRQERAEADSTRRRHLEILTQKLLAAKKLLIEVGWDAELLEAHLKANAPEGRQLAQRKFQIREARKRLNAEQAS